MESGFGSGGADPERLADQIIGTLAPSLIVCGNRSHRGAARFSAHQRKRLEAERGQTQWPETPESAGQGVSSAGNSYRTLIIPSGAAKVPSVCCGAARGEDNVDHRQRDIYIAETVAN